MRDQELQMRFGRELQLVCFLDKSGPSSSFPKNNPKAPPKEEEPLGNQLPIPRKTNQLAWSLESTEGFLKQIRERIPSRSEGSIHTQKARTWQLLFCVFTTKTILSFLNPSRQ